MLKEKKKNQPVVKTNNMLVAKPRPHIRTPRSASSTGPNRESKKLRIQWETKSVAARGKSTPTPVRKQRESHDESTPQMACLVGTAAAATFSRSMAEARRGVRGVEWW